MEVHAEPGELRVTLPTELTEDALRRFERREQLGVQAALRPFFHPRGVLVVGASRRRGTIGGRSSGTSYNTGSKVLCTP